MIQIYCKNTDSYKDFTEGTTLYEIAKAFDFERPYDILAARVNNVVEGLYFRVFTNKDVEFIDYRCYSGRSVYTRSLCFLLYKAAKDLFPDCEVVIRRPISKGFLCSVIKKDGIASTADIAAISARMEEIVAANMAFNRHEVRTDQAIELFKKLGNHDKAKLLMTYNDVYIAYYTLGGTADFYYDALLPTSGYLKIWSLTPYRGDLLLRVPDRKKPNELAPFFEQPKTYEIFKETLYWNRIMGLDNVGDVNLACLDGKARDLIQVAEALQEKKIVKIAEEIERRFNSQNKVRLVLITGPTSSGKTTFCKRLSVQLKACGLHPVSFSTDDYFVNRVDTPILPDGNYDFDNFETVDHNYLQNDVLKLLSGQEVDVPEYNFVTGERELNGKKLKLKDNSVLIVEGIHALNPRLTDKVPESNKFKIFINTIISVSLDDHNSIPTSDTRLLRRIVRDFNSGAYSAKSTISNWPNVRRAESQWIYPFQEEADVLFNSSYLVEFAVFRIHAERILATVPKNCTEYSEAHRLLKFLQFFEPVSDKEVPSTSLIRSFIGNKW